MARWDYRIETVHAPGEQHAPEDLDELNRLGALGWEAVGFTPTTAVTHGLREVATTTYLVLLKRARRHSPDSSG